jgi:hypothetical protein
MKFFKDYIKKFLSTILAIFSAIAVYVAYANISHVNN